MDLEHMSQISTFGFNQKSEYLSLCAENRTVWAGAGSRFTAFAPKGRAGAG
jgi:hypothetical protein